MINRFRSVDPDPDFVTSELPSSFFALRSLKRGQWLLQAGHSQLKKYWFFRSRLLSSRGLIWKKGKLLSCLFYSISYDNFLRIAFLQMFFDKKVFWPKIFFNSSLFPLEFWPISFVLNLHHDNIFKQINFCFFCDLLKIIFLF